MNSPRLAAMTILARDDAERIARNLKAIADPTRVQLLSMIVESQDGRALVGELAKELGLTQPTVSHHMQVMVGEGLLEREQDGRQAWYTVAPGRMADVIEAIRVVEPTRPRAKPALGRISADLATRFAGVYSLETIAAIVVESYGLLAERFPDNHYLNSLTARFAGDRLTALARIERRRFDPRPSVLFVCVQNAGRSQIAAAILRSLAGDRVRVLTAGSEPAVSVNSTVVTALDEIGVPISGEFPKPLTDEVVRAADYVITMGCGDACPVYPGRRYLDWELADPVGLPLSGVREVRDQIDGLVRGLFSTMALANT
jgi:arsenate reductase (thioredoxin)